MNLPLEAEVVVAEVVEEAVGVGGVVFLVAEVEAVGLLYMAVAGVEVLMAVAVGSVEGVEGDTKGRIIKRSASKQSI